MANASTDKRDYVDTLATLAKRGGLAPIVNKLRTIALSTEDATLRSLLAPIVHHIDEAIRNQGKAKVMGLKVSDPRFKPLVDHCTACINSVKPQWQIIAEQHGWVPPTKASVSPAPKP